MAEDIDIQKVYTDTYEYLQKKFKNTSLDVQKELLEELAPYIIDSVRREGTNALFMLGLDPKNKKDKEYINRLESLGQKKESKASFDTSPLKKYGKWIAGLLVVGAAGYGVKKGVDTYFKDKPDVKKKEIFVDTTKIIDKTREDTTLTLSDTFSFEEYFLNKWKENKVQKPENIDKSKLETLSQQEKEDFIKDLIFYPLDKDTLEKVIKRVIKSLDALQVRRYETPETFFMYVKNPKTNKEVLLSYYDDMDTTFTLLSEVTGETFIVQTKEEVNTEKEESSATKVEESEGGVDMSVEIFKVQGQSLTQDEIDILTHQLVEKEDYSKLVGPNIMSTLVNMREMAISKNRDNTYFVFYKDVSNGIDIPLGEWTFEKVKKELAKLLEKGKEKKLPKNNKNTSDVDVKKDILEIPLGTSSVKIKPVEPLKLPPELVDENMIPLFKPSKTSPSANVDNLKFFGINTSLDFSKISTIPALDFNKNVTDQKRSDILKYHDFLHKQLKSIAEIFQKFEKQYAQEKNFWKFKQEVQKEIDQIIEKSSRLQRDAKENPNGINIPVIDPSHGWEMKMGLIAEKVNL